MQTFLKAPEPRTTLPSPVIPPRTVVSIVGPVRPVQPIAPPRPRPIKIGTPPPDWPQPRPQPAALVMPPVPAAPPAVGNRYRYIHTGNICMRGVQSDSAVKVPVVWEPFSPSQCTCSENGNVVSHTAGGPSLVEDIYVPSENRFVFPYREWHALCHRQ